YRTRPPERVGECALVRTISSDIRALEQCTKRSDLVIWINCRKRAVKDALRTPGIRYGATTGEIDDSSQSGTHDLCVGGRVLWWWGGQDIAECRHDWRRGRRFRRHGAEHPGRRGRQGYDVYD